MLDLAWLRGMIDDLFTYFSYSVKINMNEWF